MASADGPSAIFIHASTDGHCVAISGHVYICVR